MACVFWSAAYQSCVNGAPWFLSLLMILLTIAMAVPLRRAPGPDRDAEK